MELFGFNFLRGRDKPKKDHEQVITSFAPKETDDGATVIADLGGIRNTLIDLEGNSRTDHELVTKYRDISQHEIVSQAIDDIVNEAIVTQDGEKTVQIILDEAKIKKAVLSETIKTVIREEFDEVLSLLEFNTKAYDVFLNSYVDGRLFYHALFDPKKPEDGIKELRYLDPRRIKKIREVAKKKNNQVIQGKTVDSFGNVVKSEYYIYSDKGMYNASKLQYTPTTQGIKISPEVIIHWTSGVTDTNRKLVLSHLHTAIKPLNIVRAMQDSVVIYRISRSPERRVFYVDTGSLPPMKAEQYIKNLMVKHNNKLVYDASNGSISGMRNIHTLLEDYWIPRINGKDTTEIKTLESAYNIGDMADVQFFVNLLYRSLKVPLSRMDPDYIYDVGRATQISRDEIKFAKFVDRLRLRFNDLFLQILEKQLILKNIMTKEDWDEIRPEIKFKYLRDNIMEELKDGEVMIQRAELMMRMETVIGRYFSNEWVRRHVWKQTDADIKYEDEKMREEAEDPHFMAPEVNFGGNAPIYPGGGGPKPPGGGMAAPPPGAFMDSGPKKEDKPKKPAKKQS